jgi:hypothetical protein
MKMRIFRWLYQQTAIAGTCQLLTACLVVLLLSSCEPQDAVTQETIEAEVDPRATDFFFMRNPEIREDLLEQLTLHDIEYWVNDDDSIGFYVKDTKEVDRIANESISVWITSQ